MCFIGQVRAVRRDNGEKTDISRVFLVEQVKGMLDKIQQNLFDVAKQKRDACIEVVKTWDEFVKPEVEKDVKARTRGEMGAKVLDSIHVRHRLRKDHGIKGGIPVVFSLEKPKAQLLPFRGPSGEEDNPSDYQVRMLASYFCSFKVLCLIT
ncbi:hypothetical protein GOBAR_DD06310 [Gossypium barbadense]|nr:hypothetical protein GOBAR_DD06310 [Gossypium barbadense]